MMLPSSPHRRRTASLALAATLLVPTLLAAPGAATAQDAAPVGGHGPAGGPALRTGAAAYGDWRSDAPGVERRITPADLPAPFASHSSSNGPAVVEPPAGAAPRLPPGFTATRFAGGFETPRTMRVAPNGDIFLAESSAGRIRVLRAPDGAARPAQTTVFAQGLNLPFGIAFYPPGPDLRWIYIANTDSVLRYPYRTGDLQASGGPETVISGIMPEGGHWTRDIVFSPDGRHLFLSIGSGSNVAEGLPRRSAEEIRRIEAAHGPGAAWGEEAYRADVLVFDPDGKNGRSYANGIRNCVALAIEPAGGQPWCATNERDGLGDNLPPDYVTSLRDGAFYGWPWYYIGGNEDPRHRGERPDLKDKVTVPDILLQPHSAPLGLVFYEGAQFPARYRGDAFVALHGSWNRAQRTGYKVVRIPLKNGRPTGIYEDFMTGFVASDSSVWARPVSLAVAHDGALLVSEDGNGTIWRVSYASPTN